MAKHWRGFFDGCPPSTGWTGGYGAVVYAQTSKGRRIKEEEVFGPVHPNASVAECEAVAFLALVRLVERIAVRGDAISLHGDNQTVIHWTAGATRRHPGGASLIPKIQLGLSKLQKRCVVVISWIPREKNVRADKLSRRGRMKLSDMEFFPQKSATTE